MEFKIKALIGVLMSFTLINLIHLKEPLKRLGQYGDTIELLHSSIVNNTNFKNQAYKKTAYLVDTFGPRLWGSPQFQAAINYFKKDLEKEGFENVRFEEVTNATHWVRGKEKLTLYSPRPSPSNIPMAGLGGSEGGNITGEVIMFKTFEELKADPQRAKGNIVFFNPVWTDYSHTVKYRKNGPSIAAKYGAIACIIRSIAPKSIENPHTGSTLYDNKYERIPAAAISLESADMFERMILRKQKIVVNLYMEAEYLPPTTSYNLIAEFIGSDFPSEILLLGGHLDSWDIGPQTGANDDAAGVMVCMEAVRILIKHGLRPKRTIRFIAWSGEEFSSDNSGAHSYMSRHAEEMNDHIIAFESDEGTRNIYSFGFTGGSKGFAITRKIVEMFIYPYLNITTVEPNNGRMKDTEILYDKYKVPVMRNLVEDTLDKEYYFTYHHSSGDSVSILNADEMDKNVAGIASLFYILADLPVRLPRD